MSWRTRYRDYSEGGSRLRRHDDGMLRVPSPSGSPRISPRISPRGSPRTHQRMMYASPLAPPNMGASITSGDSKRSKNNKKKVGSQEDEGSKKPEKITDVVRTFADKTSFQGVPFIRTSLHWYSKAAWIFVFLCAVTGWVAHTYYLCNVYFSYGTTSSVKIGYDTLPFPSVTLCNINPIQKTLLPTFGTPPLQEFIASLEPKQSFSTSVGKRRKKRQAPTGSQQTTTANSGPSQTSQSQLTNQGQTQTAQTQSQLAAQGQTIQGSQASAAGVTQAPSQGQSTQASDGSDTQTTQESTTTASGSSSSNNFGLGTAQRPSLGSQFGSGNVSSGLVMEENFSKLYSEVPPPSRELMGHKAAAMILECSFNGLTCDYKNFSRVGTIDYGNCYTFNSAQSNRQSLQSSRSGPDYGLDLLMYIEEHEYLPGFRGARGIKLDIHSFNSYPNVKGSGISVSPGFHSNIGLTMLNTTRLGGLYGACDDNGTYEEFYKTRYTKQACVNTCLIRTLIANCNCSTAELNTAYARNIQAGQYQPCFRSETGSVCQAYYETLFASGQLDCGCNQACSSSSFNTEISYNKYPDFSLTYQLIDKICSGDDTTQCEYMRGSIVNVTNGDLQAMLDKNFLRLKIFYRDLNFEQVDEQPEYQESQFISDLGGCIGLWVGASAITVIEIIDLLAHCLQYCCRSKKRSERPEKHSKDMKGNSQTKDYYDHYDSQHRLDKTNNLHSVPRHNDYYHWS